MKPTNTKSSIFTLVPTSLFAGVLIILIFFAACSKDEEPAVPVVTSFELGYENSHTAFAGGDLHIEAEIVAGGKISNIILEVHPEGSHGEDQPAGVLFAWEVDTTYTAKYNGVKNATFHEHLDIPAAADTGHYHVHFIVTDLEGNRTTVEEELEMLPPSR